MALAKSQHHTAPRGQRMARSGEEDNEVHFTAMVQANPPPQAAGTEYFALDVDDMPAAGTRPDRLANVRPQEVVSRHTLEHAVDVCPFVQILDADGEPAVGYLQAPRHRVARAGFRRAHDVTRQNPAVLGRPRFSSFAGGGTVGGSANRLFFCFAPAADCRADC